MANNVFKVDIIGLESFKKHMRESPEITKKVLASAVKSVPDILASFTTARTVPVRTGELVRRFNRKVSSLAAHWFPTVKYAPFVQFGTGPRTIYPKNKKALFWKGASHPVKKVNHPGSKPNPFMNRILTTARGTIDARFKEALDVIVKRIANTR